MKTYMFLGDCVTFEIALIDVRVMLIRFKEIEYKFCEEITSVDIHKRWKNKATRQIDLEDFVFELSARLSVICVKL